MSEEVSASSQESSNHGSEASEGADIHLNADDEPGNTSDVKIGTEQGQHNNIHDLGEDSSAADADNSDEKLSQPADNEARLQQLEKEHDTLRSQYVRIAADFDNFRKRQSRDQDDLRLQLTCSTLSAILPVVDNFDRARQQLDPQGEEAQALHRSYQGLYKQLVDVLKQLGVAPMRVVGQLFDPTLHEAVLREPSDEHSEDIVVEELQRGYHLNGRVLRHALVKVSMGPGPQDEKPDPSVETSKEVPTSLDEDSQAEES
ncbi:nucleotide exchange factor GrpE [Prochlorococcus sp. MIT 1307]|uniref:nucleotide exchange factor GrpE n=1 Tax=Prochlorococcus sp. MIT 1307 TaxID=3096219 RepID=UPI002A75964C|nr:nucleotide exchange factor GrpE [Prochlorococcus sp. MIT 1307]